jgi:hypothetical protein
MPAALRVRSWRKKRRVVVLFGVCVSGKRCLCFFLCICHRRRGGGGHVKEAARIGDDANVLGAGGM